MTLQLHDKDSGIVRRGGSAFVWALTGDGWSNVEGLLEPFCESAIPGHYQWLAEGDASLLISADGRW